jgi:hypothetical protein
MAMGDDEQRRRSKPPDLLKYNEQYEMSSTRQQRTKAKVTTNTVRNNIVKRADVGAELVCMRLAVAQMTKLEWLCYIALKEGVLFDPLYDGATTRTWRVVPPPVKTATVEQVARQYGMRTETVERYERSARRILDMIRAAAGLTGDQPSVPIWPTIQNDETLLRFLFPSNTRK